ncbi:unnamed protein product [Somion occarium]|uniref:Uncharacterized protein n=1 Tax=Somion occarium TaxID=3059160 RepID=A0ABP1CL81_9APHY
MFEGQFLNRHSVEVITKATPPVQIQKVRLPATAPKSAPPVQKVDIFKGNERAQPAPPAKKPPAPQASNERASSPSSLFSAPSTPNISANKTLPSAPEPIRPKPAEPPTKPLPSHRAPGRIKLMDFSEQNTSSGSTIPTKLRIARGASGSGPKPAQAAKAVNQTTNKPSLEDIIPKKPSLSLLNFKRKPKGAEDGKSPTSPQVASATSSTGGFDFGQRSAGQSSKFSDVGSLVRSPASMHDDLPGDQLNDINYLFEEPPPPSAAPVERPKDPRRQLPRRTSMQKQDLMVEADLLLSTMMPPALAAPMHEPTGQEELTSPVAGPSGFTASRIVQQQSMSRIPKKWKWTGELYMDTGHDMATKLCSITLSDPTEPKPQGLRLNICLSTADSIRFKKLHDAPDLPTMLQASEPVQQFCRVTHKEAEDLNALKTLQTYMTKKRMFTYAHVYLDHNPVALLVVFPSTHTDICNLLKVPLYLAHDGALIAALIPWTLASEQYQKNRWTKSRSLISATEHGLDPGFTELFKTTGKQLILTHPSLQRGLRIHKFPKKLFDSLTKKPYCVWFSPTDGPMNSPGFETASLKAVLKACGAFDVGYKKDVKAIFVHVGALNTMHKVPSIANRRAKIPDLRFFTYGTHETVPPERWGVREVYPIGGCVTFTPSAFLEDPIGVYQLIKKFDEHPFWAVFLPPNVVGVIAKMVCNGIDPVSVFDSDSFVFTPLLKSIKEGEVSLLTAPPLQRYPKESLSVERRWDDPAMTWIVAQFHQMSMTPRDLLDSCMRSLQEKHANADDKTLVATIGREALEEMRQMQFQPVLMDSYRRFVVIKARKETDLNDRNDTLECTSLGEFKFRDEAFDLPKK